MTDNYFRIVQANLKKLYSPLPMDLDRNLPAVRNKDEFIFTAFGETCRITPDAIILSGGNHPSVLGILISLYALHARPEPCVDEPFRAFKEFGGTAPYVGAFASHTEAILVPHVAAIKKKRGAVTGRLDGRDAPRGTGGDFAFIVRPLPKIALCYIFYESDEDFPASATCLYSGNAGSFLPVDGLADVGEYTSRAILSIISG